MSSIQESRQFRMHPDLLFSVIKAQAGTISKAILELVMNSVDAGATRVAIKLDRKSVEVKDDGNGFNKQEQIDEFFETFGTPHVEGDATYGRFRMGRGQIMAFTVNQWRSGPFKMSVDIQGKGLDYTLEKDLPIAAGCVIKGQLYEPLDPSELITTERAIKEQCRYTPIPVFLNGKEISERAEGQKWSHRDEDAFIRVDNSRQLSVYNLGVLVSHFSAADFGVGGVVVSKKQLDLNFARNDILRNKCQVWKRIRPVLAKFSAELNKKEPAQKKTEEWREFQAKNLASLTQANYSQYRELAEMPLFTDISGKHLSLEQLSRQARQRSIAVSTSKSLTADKLHQSKIACVLSAESFIGRFGMNLEEVLSHLDSISSVDARGSENHFHHGVETIRKAIVDFEELAKTLKSDHHIMESSKLPKEAAACVRAIQDAQWHIIRALSDDSHGDRRIAARKIMAMESETSDAFTDGKAHIFINLKLLRGLDGPNQGVAWASRMAVLLIHEYCHDFDSGLGHQHDENFAGAVVDGVQSKAFGDAVAKLLMGWAHESKSSLGKVSQKLMIQMDKQARMDDHMELQGA